MKPFAKKASLTAWSLALAVYTVVAFHLPLFKFILSNKGDGANGFFLIVSAALVLLAVDFLLYYILVFLCRFAGKCIVAFTLLGDAAMLYFVNNYNVYVTKAVMGSVFETQYTEASGFFSFSAILYVLLLGILPCIYVFARKVEYGSWKRFFIRIGIAAALLLAVCAVNLKKRPWVDRYSTELGGLLMPWSYVVNTVGYFCSAQNAEEILLPDPTAISDSRDVCLLIIGESIRRDHLSLYGYERETCPYTSKDSLTTLAAISSDTYTSASVRAILEPTEDRELHEILPNYILRAGGDVIWRTSNWSEPPVHTEKYYTAADLGKMYPDADSRYDSILLEGVKEEILGSDKDKVFIVLHTYTCHGPAYNLKYPKEFEVFTPAGNTVEMSKASQEDIVNSYDNCLVYTDYLIHSVIDIVRDIPDRRACVLFVSDHGESLGENDIYMHGTPLAVAPWEQRDIPFMVWTSDHSLKVKPVDQVGQHHVFHSVIRFLGIESPAYDASKDIFE